MEKYIFALALAIHAIALHGMESPYQKQKNLDASLRTAAMNGKVEEIKTLIKAGANSCATDQGDYTALVLAAWQGHRSTCKLLVAEILAPSKSQKREICIFLGYLKMNRTKGDYYNLQNIFKETFYKFCKEINAPNACQQIKRIGIHWNETRQELLQILL